MTAAAGDRIGPYEIVSRIGKGGMGEVFHARDTRLNRDVAIKFSADQFSERFEREARAIAALNHPLICHLYDVGPNYLVMELVEGPTLADRLVGAALPIDEALDIARQIADALEAAHEKGIVHRDLKPGNVKVKPDGSVKVLDFGLAKLGAAPMGLSGDNSPTFTFDGTQAGVILGTAAYMSPEQAKGRPVDQRADIYAFGAVLYEMVTGARLHKGDATTEVLASVIKDEPDWARVPPRLQRLLRRCLDKDPQKRLRHIGDVMALVDDDAPLIKPAPPAFPAARRRVRWTLIAVATTAVVAIAALAVWAPWRSQVAAPSIRFEIPPTDAMTFITGGYPMVSPNGKWVVLPAVGKDGVTRMWLRALDSVEVRPLIGTESGNALPPPVFWSPDSRFIAFSSTPGPFAPGQLKKLDISGGPAQTICDVLAAVSGGTWGPDGTILFAANRAGTGIFRVPAAGGTAIPATVADVVRRDSAHRYPKFLPDGRHFLYLRATPEFARQGLVVGSIDLPADQQPDTILMSTDRQAFYAPPMAGVPGRLVFLRDTTLFAQPFDPTRFQLSGEPVPIADQVGSFPAANAGLFSVSDTGVLAYRVGAGGRQVQLTWFEVDGKTSGVVGDKGNYTDPTLSPDNSRVAVTQFDQTSGNSNIWVLDVMRGTSVKVTFAAGRNAFPIWSPDSKKVAYASNRDGFLDIYARNADGSGDDTVLLKSGADKQPRAWSNDGRFILFTSFDAKTQNDIWALPLEGERKPFPVIAGPANDNAPALSPDSRWLSYTSDESGTPETFVVPFDAEKGKPASSGGKWLVSKGGGVNPVWVDHQLFYGTLTLQQMAVDFTAETIFKAGIPRPLFQFPYLSRFSVTADGKRFLHITPELSSAQSPFIVVSNWQAGLK
jgi:Tol biopolymer transport system component/predicted Ser/Thr protein kinase